MKLVLSRGNRDVIYLNVLLTRTSGLSVSTHIWRKHPTPTPSKPADPGPTMRANGHLQSSERAGSMQPDTTTFGFNRRR